MKNKAFTILEVIAAIFVMTVGVLGAYSVVQQIIVYTSISSSRLTAAYLAKEGIEIVRNIRDTNWLTVPSVDWNNGLGAGDYEADWDDENLTSCSSPCDFDNNLRFLKIYTNYYTYNAGEQYNTKFKRKIIITPDGADKLKVSVLIEWAEKGNTYTVTVEEHLYNWY